MGHLEQLTMATIHSADANAVAEQAKKSAHERGKLNVVLFSGGTGTNSITEALLRQKSVSLTILINAYDDGHSTGRLRRFIPGMLGPSDVRKNVNRLMPDEDACYRALKWLSDQRLPQGATTAEAMRVLQPIADGNTSRIAAPYVDAYKQLMVRHAEEFSGYIKAYLQYASQRSSDGVEFDYNDCALGNLLFAGCYLLNNQDFNQTTEAFCRFYDARAQLLNITLGENLFLIARTESGRYLWSEADIVGSPSDSKLKDLALLDQATYARALAENWQDLPSGTAVIPQLNAKADLAIRAADMIIYGPGTQHSSLFPSYLTKGVAEAIQSNKEADKIFVGNIRRDVDMQQDDINDLADKFIANMSRYGEVGVEWNDVVTHFLVHGREVGEPRPSQPAYIPFDPTKFRYALNTVHVRDWEYGDGRHAGGYLVSEIQQIVQARIALQLQPSHHLVSIVVPALNESKTIEETLKRLLELDFQELGLGKEIIVVDGGSTDNTAQIAASVPSIKLLNVPAGSGRGAALRCGIEKARGTVVCFFPADLEYLVSDVTSLVGTVATGKFKAVFGTRAIRVSDLNHVLRKIYEDSYGLFLVSKYGGMLISIATLLLYNRYISDTLTSLKAFDAELLRSLKLKNNGVDLETEIVAKLCRQGQFIFEIPVEYRPRTRSQGKKITVLDGVKTLFTLMRVRLANA
jgi:2-phospho-L-lactate transferase/gluconeogenesis factor (CofD/UPF0052 family)